MTTPSRIEQHRYALIALLGVIVVVAAYVPRITGAFFFADDYYYIGNNPALTGLALSESWRVFAGGTNPWEYLPLRDLSYLFDLALGGLEPGVFIAHNLVLYGVTLVAAWFATCAVMAALGMPGNGPRTPAIAAATVLLFAAHPAHVESVAWAAGRKDILSGLFAVLSLWAFAAGLTATRRSIVRYAASYLLFACAILSKSTVVSMPCLAFALAVAYRPAGRTLLSRLRGALVATLPLFALATLSVALQVLLSESSPLHAETGADLPWHPGSPALAVRILGMLTRIAVVPVRLRLVYDLAHPEWIGSVCLVLGLLVIAAACVAAWRIVQRPSPWAVGLFGFAVLCLPFLQLIPFVTWSFASERFLYLALWPLCWSVASGMATWRTYPRWGVLLMLFVALTAGSVARVVDWRSERLLFAKNQQYSPRDKIAARLYIRTVLVAEHDFDEARRVAADAQDRPEERAFLLRYIDMKEAEAAGRIDRLRELAMGMVDVDLKDDAEIGLDLGNMILEVGMPGPAETMYRRVLERFPRHPEAHFDLGLALAKQGRHAAAAVEMRIAIESGFVGTKPWNNLAVALRNAGDYAGAEQAFRRALATDPLHWHAAYNLARMFAMRGRNSEAQAALDEARRRAVRAGDATDPIDALSRAIGGGPGPLPRE